ncbi:MAG: hypothetical protein ACRDUA_25185, partial [Micromonosporaceae bacterium]
MTKHGPHSAGGPVDPVVGHPWPPQRKLPTTALDHLIRGQPQQHHAADKSIDGARLVNPPRVELPADSLGHRRRG